MFPLNTIIAWSINIIMNKKYDNNNIIIASRAYFLHSELWTPVLFPSYCYHLFTLLVLFTLLAYYIVFTRYAHNLCFKQSGEIDNLIVSWEHSTWLCCVQVPHCYWPKMSSTSIVNGALVGVLLSQSASPLVVCLASPDRY
jgi:hypothetical protein